ncbi:MAG: hypothetical protein FWB96_07070 [Defluviitaleaceae bacterium]|nr:hypothetical protein [Defluviitaleaceae bacterium]MCL2264017.1 hypothetical protein [Defluviitaleaceae bacterium]
MPTHQWLIAALCDEETNTKQIELALLNDINKAKNDFAAIESKPFPYDVELLFEWIPISEIEPGINRGYDNLVELSIASRIRTKKQLHDLTLRGLAMLLDRDLLIRNNLGDIFAPIVKYPFFNPTREPAHFMCCFGDTPSDGMRCAVTSNNVCLTYGWCATCDTVANCRHTCYWHLLKLLLGAYPVPRPNPFPHKTIASLLPDKFIY